MRSTETGPVPVLKRRPGSFLHQSRVGDGLTWLLSALLAFCFLTYAAMIAFL